MNIRRAIKIVERGWYFSRLFFFLLVVLAIIHTFFLTIFIVDGLSMHPTLKNRQVLFVNKIYALIHPPKKDDVVILQFPGDPERRMFVKRIIGEPGNEFIAGTSDRYGEVSTKSFKLGVGQYYVLGDNRAGSGDSRIWGSVPRENIIGVVLKY